MYTSYTEESRYKLWRKKMFILFSQDILGAIKDEFQQFKTLWIILKIKGNLGYKIMKPAEILYPIHFFLHDCKNAQFFFQLYGTICITVHASANTSTSVQNFWSQIRRWKDTFRFIQFVSYWQIRDIGMQISN